MQYDYIRLLDSVTVGLVYTLPEDITTYHTQPLSEFC